MTELPACINEPGFHGFHCSCMPSPFDEPNPWRRQVEARAHIQEAMRLLDGELWRATVCLLDRASDSIRYVIDAAGYNSWEYARPIAGKHEEVENVWNR